MAERTTLLVVGPTPPPHHGVSMAMHVLLNSSITTTFHVVHLDITDRRGIGHVDKPDLYDVFLFTKQFFRNLVFILKESPRLFYLPISQTRIGFLRDSLFILPAFMARIPVIVHLHGANLNVLYTEAGPLWRAYMGVILRNVSRFIVLGEMLRPIFGRWATPKQISVVPNGVPCSAARDGSPRSRGGVFRVVFLSSLSRQKGLFVLLQAIPLVVKDHPEVDIRIAGPWWGETTQREAQNCLAALDITGKVHFVGSVTGPQKSEFLRAGDVFVFPGVQQEGQPLTVLEAMSEGLPVIATDRGCLRETVLDGVTGFIVPPNSPQAIAAKIVQLIRDPALRDQMAVNALERVRHLYTPERFASRLNDVFLRTLASAPGRSTHQQRVGCNP